MELTEKDVLDQVKRQWETKIEQLKADYAKYMGSDEEEHKKEKSKKNTKTNKNKIKIDTTMNLLSRGIRLKHKDSGLEYTVVSASPRDVILRTPEGRAFTVSAEEVNKDYLLD